jgi:nucleoside-diphosphate-sugar epimerase
VVEEARGASGGDVSGRLAGRTILLTGGTGFLGKTVLATLLSRAPDIGRVLLLLRAPDPEGADRRLAEVVESEAFAAVDRDAIREMIASGRIAALHGDLADEGLPGKLRGRLGEVETVIHCAASVSFEEALDSAVALNALGAARLLDCLRADGAEPHFVHVSTAYAADCSHSLVREDGPDHPGLAKLDPDEMRSAAAGWRERVEAEADSPAKRRFFEHHAKRDAAHRAGIDPGDRARQLRARWVDQELARHGRRYANAAGWPDTYALTKALAERLVAERSQRTTILRPSIIESALAYPHPGWLEGIKVADPLMLAYASRGLTHLPGRADNRIDIVPVDFVANACVAAAAHPPGDGLRTAAVTSTPGNPLTLGELAGHVRSYFGGEPLHRGDGKPIEVGDLKFVDRRVALRKTIRRERLLAALARAAAALPGTPAAERNLRRNRVLTARVTRMVKIYGPYTELDCVFDNANARELAASLTDSDRVELPFDAGSYDWTKYLEGVHLPRIRSMVERGKGRAEPPPSVPTAAAT